MKLITIGKDKAIGIQSLVKGWLNPLKSSCIRTGETTVNGDLCTFSPERKYFLKSVKIKYSFLEKKE